MQVFLPYSDFQKSVQCLDPKRLGNQVYRECLTLIRGAWPNHPASKMWKGYEKSLARYALFGLKELSKRGRNYPHHIITFEEYLNRTGTEENPPWLGNGRLHASHRSNLLRKNREWYGKFGWTESDDLPYFWPTKEEKSE